jgi:hypothetical protein
VHLIEDLQVIARATPARPATTDRRRQGRHAPNGTRHARAYRAPSRPALDHHAIKQDERVAADEDAATDPQRERRLSRRALAVGIASPAPTALRRPGPARPRAPLQRIWRRGGRRSSSGLGRGAGVASSAKTGGAAGVPAAVRRLGAVPVLVLGGCGAADTLLPRHASPLLEGGLPLAGPALLPLADPSGGLAGLHAASPRAAACAPRQEPGILSRRALSPHIPASVDVGEGFVRKSRDQFVDCRRARATDHRLKRDRGRSMCVSADATPSIAASGEGGRAGGTTAPGRGRCHVRRLKPRRYRADDRSCRRQPALGQLRAGRHRWRSAMNADGS